MKQLDTLIVRVLRITCDEKCVLSRYIQKLLLLRDHLSDMPRPNNLTI